MAVGLVVIDAQEGFRNEHTEDAIHLISAEILSRSRDKIFFTRFINSPNSQFERALNWASMQSDSETHLVPEIAGLAVSTNVFTKSTNWRLILLKYAVSTQMPVLLPRHLMPSTSVLNYIF